MNIAELEREGGTRFNTLIRDPRHGPVGGPPRGGERAGESSRPFPPIRCSCRTGSDPNTLTHGVVSPAEIRWATVAVGGRVIAEKVAAFSTARWRGFIDMPLERRLQDARALYELIIPARSSRGLSGVACANWVLIPDGALDYVPLRCASRQRTLSRSRLLQLQHDVALPHRPAWMLDNPWDAGRATRAQQPCCSSPIRCIRRMIRGSRRSGKAAPTTQSFDPASASTPAPSRTISAPCVLTAQEGRADPGRIFRRRRSIN